MATAKQYKLPESIEKWAHVAVTWEDAMTSGGASNSETFVRDFKPCIRKSTGYVIGYNENYIFLASTDDRDNNFDQGDDCEDITVIPLAYVRRILRR